MSRAQFDFSKLSIAERIQLAEEHRRDKGPVDGRCVLSTPALPRDRSAAAAGSRVPPPPTYSARRALVNLKYKNQIESIESMYQGN